MTTSLVPAGASDLQVFSDDEIKRAGELLGCELDRTSALRALILQRDSGGILSIVRGEISVVTYGDKHVVQINRSGYLAYASAQPDYDGYTSHIETRKYPITGKEEACAWCEVRRKGISQPIVSQTIWFSEFNKGTATWKTMPMYMLEKVAISIGLRTAFPVLNGTYSEDELEGSVKIQPRESDIIVEPVESPVPAPASEPAPEQKDPDCQMYTYAQANSCLENFKANGYDISVFGSAKLKNGMYNRDMIDADFKRQADLKKKAKQPASKCPVCGKPSMSKQDAEILKMAMDGEQFDQTLCKDCATKLWNEKNSKPAPAEPASSVELSKTPCRDCGKKVLKSEEKISQEKYGITLCPDCFAKRLEADIKKAAEDKALVQNLLASAEADTAICSSCGKKLTPEEYKRSIESKFKKPLCPECWVKQYGQKKE